MSSSDNQINPFTKKAYTANHAVLRKITETLPISRNIPRLLSSIKQHPVVILVGETGSGKTTQVPKHILLDNELDKSGRKIALTQNRRLAAGLVAARIAEELDVQLGTIVGLKYRGRNQTSRSTKLDVVTDGTLVQAAKSDPSLEAYGVIIIDEAHQHTVATDLLLGLLKRLIIQRKDDLKVIIMSATIDADLFSNFFPGSVVEEVKGREYKVLEKYLAKPPEDEIATIVATILNVHLTGQPGNILVFVSGVREMSTIIEKVEEALGGEKALFGGHEIGPLVCLPLHATLAEKAQDQAVESVAPGPQEAKFGRKLLVATNIAETSVTLTGVTHVIDSCKFKSKVWNPEDESWSLIEQWISKAVARQRAGRAGRTKEGVVYRMCTESGFHQQLSEHSVSAIMEGDMLDECLHILKMGHQPLTFPYIVAPAPETIVKALAMLTVLGAIDDKGNLTRRGEGITLLPVDVYSAIALLDSCRYGCSEEILSLISMVEASDGGNDVFIKTSDREMKMKIRRIREGFNHHSGDHITLFNIYMAWRGACIDKTEDGFLESNMLDGRILRSADQTRLQLLEILMKSQFWQLKLHDPSEPHYYVHMLKALAAGHCLRVAKRRSLSEPKVYETVRHCTQVELGPDTNLGAASRDNEWVIYNEYHSGKKNTIRLVSAIPPEILISEHAPYWSDLEFLPEGHIKDSLVKVIANMTGESETYLRGGMPKKPASSQ